MMYHKVLNWGALCIALVVSTCAAYFSVIGLMALFAAEASRVMIIAIVLEAAKVITAAWAHMNWKHLKKSIKIYLSIAVIILMVITSIGIFGFLSKAHLQNDVVNTAELTTEMKIITNKINLGGTRAHDIEDRLVRLRSPEEAAIKKGHLRTARSARNQAKKEIEKLENEKLNIQNELAILQADKIKLESEKDIKDVEIGPFKYIAQIIYERPEEHTSSVVKAIIIIIVAVFDPLAIMLLIGAGSVLVPYENLVYNKSDRPSKPPAKRTVAVSRGRHTNGSVEVPKRNIKRIR